MTNWMGQVVEAAEHPGFEVRQTAEATWILRKGTVTPPPNGSASRLAPRRRTGLPARVRR
jgi:hypothetical protein